MRAMARRAVLVEPWFAPFALVNASAVGLLAALAASGHVPSFLPLAAFAGIMFAWSFLAGTIRPPWALGAATVGLTIFLTRPSCVSTSEWRDK
jgi:hypothetical protein